MNLSDLTIFCAEQPRTAAGLILALKEWSQAMTPLELKLLLHYHLSRDLYPLSTRYIKEATRDMFVAELIIANEDTRGYKTTAKGAALIAMLCQTPMPEQVYIDPRTGERIQP